MNEFENVCFTDSIANKRAYLENFGVTRGLDNEYLNSISFSLLSEYWLHLQPGGPNTQFIKGANIDDIVTCYVFDRDLKYLLMGMIQDIEISLKQVCIAYIYKYSKSGHSLKDNTWLSTKYVNFTRDASNKDARVQARAHEKLKVYKDFLSKVDKVTDNMNMNHVPNFRIINKMSFGSIRCIYEISCYDMKKDMVSYYSMDSRHQFGTLLAALNSIRNRSAHYERVWNRSTNSVRVSQHNQVLHSVVTTDEYHEQKIYNTLVWMIYMLNKINSKNTWKYKFLNLVDEHQDRNYTKRMGFPDDWRSMDFWSV
ncbi:MAG: Abi family protein [Gammaproteobacteria bacterium WSBS_2016_MAG_OTU1]